MYLDSADIAAVRIQPAFLRKYHQVSKLVCMPTAKELWERKYSEFCLFHAAEYLLFEPETVGRSTCFCCNYSTIQTFHSSCWYHPGKGGLEAVLDDVWHLPQSPMYACVTSPILTWDQHQDYRIKLSMPHRQVTDPCCQYQENLFPCYMSDWWNQTLFQYAYSIT